MRYNDAVEEALCFGWIDSTYRPLSPTLGMQRYTPRRKIGENYSQPNLERLKWVDSKVFGLGGGGGWGAGKQGEKVSKKVFFSRNKKSITPPPQLVPLGTWRRV